MQLLFDSSLSTQPPFSIFPSFSASFISIVLCLVFVQTHTRNIAKYFQNYMSHYDEVGPTNSGPNFWSFIV